MVEKSFTCADLEWKLQAIHKKQLFIFDQFFDDHIKSDRFCINHYFKYIIWLLNRREESQFNWKLNTHEDINMYITFIYNYNNLTSSN